MWVVYFAKRFFSFQNAIITLRNPTLALTAQCNAIALRQIAAPWGSTFTRATKVRAALLDPFMAIFTSAFQTSGIKKEGLEGVAGVTIAVKKASSCFHEAGCDTISLT